MFSTKILLIIAVTVLLYYLYTGCYLREGVGGDDGDGGAGAGAGEKKVATVVNFCKGSAQEKAHGMGTDAFMHLGIPDDLCVSTNTNNCKKYDLNTWDDSGNKVGAEDCSDECATWRKDGDADASRCWMWTWDDAVKAENRCTLYTRTPSTDQLCPADDCDPILFGCGTGGSSAVGGLSKDEDGYTYYGGHSDGQRYSGIMKDTCGNVLLQFQDTKGEDCGYLRYMTTHKNGKNIAYSEYIGKPSPSDNSKKWSTVIKECYKPDEEEGEEEEEEDDDDSEIKVTIAGDTDLTYDAKDITGDIDETDVEATDVDSIVADILEKEEEDDDEMIPLPLDTVGIKLYARENFALINSNSCPKEKISGRCMIGGIPFN